MDSLQKYLNDLKICLINDSLSVVKPYFFLFIFFIFITHQFLINKNSILKKNNFKIKK